MGKDFRMAYSKLHQLRSVVGGGVPWFACSSTLDKKTMGVVKKGLGFREGVDIMRTSINRPEFLLQMAQIPVSKGKFAALRFLFDSSPDRPVYTPQEIPKTIVFFDSKKDAYNAEEGCQYWLQHNAQPEYSPGSRRHYSARQALETIKVFQSNAAEFDKQQIIEEFRKPESGIRVLMSTEALALGVDFPDIERVVVYRFPQNLQPATLWQRGGRACRHGQEGRIIVLADRWVFGPAKQPVGKGKGFESEDAEAEIYEGLSDSETEEAIPAKKGRISDAERRGKLPEFWYAFANDPSCLRKRLLDFFLRNIASVNCIIEYRQLVNYLLCHCMTH